MAIMIPSSFDEDRTVSGAERKLFNEFRRKLPDDVLVLHSLGIANHVNKLWGEIDFVIICSRGVFVIEVKGGGVECVSGEWIYTNRDGRQHRSHVSPFEQAKSGMYSIRDVLRNSIGRDLVIGYGVLMPDSYFDVDSPEINLEVLRDRRSAMLPLGDYLDKLCTYWANAFRKKSRNAPARLKESEIEKLRQALRPDIKTAYTLSSRLAQAEEQLAVLTEEQAEIVRKLDTNPRVLINGGAGTGKTLIALDKARRSAADGRRVLFLCYNVLLGDHLREAAQSQGWTENLEIWPVCDFYTHTVLKSSLEDQIQPETGNEEYYLHRLPELFMEACIEIELMPFDVLIVDEGQDFLSTVFLDCADLLLEGGITYGAWHFFIDPQQSIYSADVGTAVERLKQVGMTEFPLTVNCRNAQKVAETTELVSEISFPHVRADVGGQADVRFAERAAIPSQTERIIGQLVEGGLQRKDIIVLGTHTLKNSAFVEGKAGKYTLNDLKEPLDDEVRNQVDYCTMHSFKGLERTAVIAADLRDLDDAKDRLLHYSGLSRARSALFVLIDPDQQKQYEDHVARYSS